MEQHPVPQNVTTFQFRLIGDMTIKQFGYLAAGAIVGFICYKLPIPVFFALPLAVVVFLLGFGMAFVPIEERPMDRWILSFIKSIYNPTLYTWQRHKEGFVPASPQQQNNPKTVVQGPLSEGTKQVQKPTEAPAPTPQTLVQPQTPVDDQQNQAPSSPVPPAQPVIRKPSAIDRFLAWLFPPKSQTVTLPGAEPQKTQTQAPNTAGRQTDILTGVFAHRAKTNAIPPPGPIKSDPFAHLQMPSVTGKPTAYVTEQPKQEKQVPSPEDQKHLIELDAKNKDLENKLSDLAGKLQEKSDSEGRIVELQKQLTDVLSEKQRMEAELTSIRTKLTQQQASPAQQTQAAGVTQQPERRGPTVRIITPEGAILAGLPKLTTYPNVVTGIIKDYDANLLPGVLVTVRDKDDVPLRALKTNKLGQFAASTPLPNSTYFIEVEDPRGRFTFDRIQITLNGSLVPAVEVVAKSQKQIEREKLEKQIFGNQQF